MILLSASKLAMAFGADTLFEDVSFHIAGQDKIGLVGVNGAGKTTLFKMLLGEISPQKGELFRNKQAKVGYLSQHTGEGSRRTVWDEVLEVFSDLSAMEQELAHLQERMDARPPDLEALVEKHHNLSEEYERQGGFTYQSRAKAALLGLGFSEGELSQAVSSLSGGQKTRVYLARLLLSQNNLLLLDEPTNHLDIQSVEWLENYLKSYEGAFVVISHDRYFLDRVTGRTFILENGRLSVYEGNYSQAMAKKEASDEAILRHDENTEKEIKRLEAVIKQQRQWNREKNIRTAESKQKMIDRLQKERIRPDARPKEIHFQFTAKQKGSQEALTASELSKGFGDKKLFQNVGLNIKNGERIFLLGPNGCGKTTLLKILLGKLSPDSGQVHRAVSTTFGYYDQIQADLHGEKTVMDEVWDAFPKMTETEIRNALAAFLFRGDDVFKVISSLSGGEKARVALLKLMLEGANFLLLDEPTNHLDIASCEALEKALFGYDGTLFVVSHDRYLINRMAEKIFELGDEGIKVYLGNYDDYLEKRKTDSVEAVQKKPKQLDYQAQKAQAAAKRRVASRLQKAEAEVAETEAAIAAYNEELLKPELAADYVRAMEIQKEIDALEEKLLSLMEEWETLQNEAAQWEELS